MNTLTVKYAINGTLIGLICTLLTWFICLLTIGSAVRESATAITKVMHIGPLAIGEVSKVESTTGSTITIVATAGLAWLIGACIVIGILGGVILAHRKTRSIVNAA